MELVSFNSENFHFLAFFGPGAPPRSDFGSHLPTKDLLVPKRLLTSQQARDRPPGLSSVSKLCPVHLSHQDQL
jgi:hypothetical protein